MSSSTHRRSCRSSMPAWLPQATRPWCSWCARASRVVASPSVRLDNSTAPADFGIISAALSVITFIEIFSQASIGPAIVQRHRIEARHLRTALGLAITIGTVTGVGIWFLAGGLAALLRMPDLKAVLRVLA